MRVYFWIVLFTVIGLVSCGREAVEPVGGTISATRAKRMKQSQAKPSRTFVSQNGRTTNLVYTTAYFVNESCGVVELERELDKDPGNADLWYRLGMVWQNQMNDTSNAIVCFEKAIELAPDAYQPRSFLFNCYMQQNNREKIQKTFVDLCAYATEENQHIGLIQQAMGLVDQGHLSKNILEEQFGGDDIVGCYLSASFSLREKDYTAAAQQVIRGYDLTTNTMTRRYLGYISQQLERADTCDTEMRERLSAIKVANMAPHLRALYNPETKNIQIPSEISIEEFNRALSLATTENEQWEVLGLASRSINEPGLEKTTELKEAIKAVLGTNIPPEKYMHNALHLYSAVGLTNQMTSLVQYYIDKPDLTAQKLKQLLSYLRMAKYNRNGSRYYRSDEYTPLSEEMEEILAKILDRFPNNGEMLSVVSEEYARSGCIQEELDTRDQALLCENIAEHTRAQMAAKLIEGYIREDMPEKAQEIMSEHELLTHTYQALAAACARVYCHQNDTNGAWDVLSGCAGESRFVKERIGAAAALLDYRWHDKQQIAWIADTMIREMTGLANGDRIINLLQRQQRQAFVDILTQLGREEDILAIVEQRFLHGSPWSGQDIMPKGLGAEKFKAMIDRLEAAGKTSQYNYSSLVEMSRNLGFAKLELELRMKALEGRPSYYDVTEALRLASKLKDTAACETLATMIEQKPEIAADINTLLNLGDPMRACGMQTRFDALLEKRLTTMTNVPDSYITQQLLQWGKTNTVAAFFDRAYMGPIGSFDQQNKLLMLAIQLNKQKNEVGVIFDRVCQSADTSFEQQNTLLTLALQLNKQEYVQKFAGNLADALTNATAITQHGEQYLRALSQLARTDAAYTDQRDEMITEWLENTEVPITVRHRLAQHIPQDSDACRDAMLALLEEKPEEHLVPQIQQSLLEFYQRTGNTDELLALTDTMLENPALPDHVQQNLVDTLSAAGKPDRALELCERIMALGSDEHRKKEAMNRAMQLCIELNAPERALEYADQLVAELRPGNTQQANNLLSVYQQAGQPDKALKLCLDTMRITGDDQQLSYLASNLKQLSQKYTMDVAEECQSIIAELGGRERTPERLAVMASLADIAGDSDAAFGYLEDAAQAALHPDRQAQYYRQMADMCREQKMPDKELEVLEKSITVLEPRQQGSTVNRILSLLQEQKRYDDAIARGKEFMENPAYATLETYARDDFMQSMVNVCISAKDTDQAWKMAQNINNMNSFMNYASRLDRLDDALPRIEKHLDSDAPVKDKIYVMRDLLNVYQRNKKTDEIEATISRLDTLVDGTVPNHLLTTIAYMYDSAGQPDKAITYMKQNCEALQGDQREGGVTTLARMLQKNDRADEALALLNAEPQSMSILESKGQVLQSMKDYPAAAEAYLAALQNIPAQDAWRVSNYANTLASLARNCNDENLTGKIIKQVLAKQDGPAYSAAATIYERLGKYEDAAQCLATTIERTDNPDTKRDVLQRFANCSEQAKNYDDAIQAFDTLVKDDKTQWQSRVGYQQQMANVYSKADRPNAAREVLRDAVRECDREIQRLGKKQNAVDVYSQKATLYKKMGDPSAARDTLQYIADHYRGSRQAERAQQQLKRL